MKPITEVAQALGIEPAHVEPYGHWKAKLALKSFVGKPARGKLVLVSAITPTPAGEGKTTTSVGLAQGLARIGVRSAVALREPSLGPVFGMKGGGAGGGRSEVVPVNDVNLHLNGDFHAVSSAHNLLSALVDNHLHFGSPSGLDPRRVTWKRVMDMNDRSLRDIVVGLGGRTEGVPRETGFDITAASEVMAILCLADGIADLKARLGRIVVGYRQDGSAVTAADLKAVGAMAVLLRDALKPNLLQTTEGVPAFIHGGPFANIAHGTNTLNATRAALAYADVVVTEGGFAFDLGAEKFFDINCGYGGFAPACTVLVATIRALKMHGGVPLANVGTPDVAAMLRGCANLERHLESAAKFGPPAVVAINHFPTDTDEEIAALQAHCASLGVKSAVARSFAVGGEGVTELDPSGEPFDPHRHEALLSQPSDQPEGTVIDVLQKGFLLGDRVLRPLLRIPEPATARHRQDQRVTGLQLDLGAQHDPPAVHFRDRLRHLLPAFQPKPLPEDAGGNAQLKQTLTGLEAHPKSK